MALDKLNYGLSRNDTPAEAAHERAVAAERTSAAVRPNDVERVNYGGQTVEIGKIDHAALGRPVDKQYERNLASVESRLAKIGVSTATVVNFLPIKLRSDSVLGPLRNLIIPEPKDDQAYVTYSFTDAFIEPARMGADSPLIAFEHHPIELAEEFFRVYNGAVFTFTGIPSDLDREDWKNKVSTEPSHHGMTYGAAFQAAYQKSIEWMYEMLKQGNDNNRLKRMPTEPQKAAARRLKVLGRIKEFPEWVERQIDVDTKIPMCPKCQRPSEVGACQCTNQNCGYIIDPRKAYEINAIGEDHPSLERLTRAEVKEMGISDYVAETRDEKKARLEIGGIKPLSIAAARLQQSNDELLSLQAKENAAAIAAAVSGAKSKKE